LIRPKPIRVAVLIEEEEEEEEGLYIEDVFMN